MKKFGCNVRVATVAESPYDTKIDVKPDVYTFVYTYPLSHDAEFEHTLDGDETVMYILRLAAQDYTQIYAVEDQTSELDVIPVEKRRPLLNRNSTDGKYGIWGHDMDDLWFEGIYIDEEKRRVTFSIGS